MESLGMLISVTRIKLITFKIEARLLYATLLVLKFKSMIKNFFEKFLKKKQCLNGQ